MTKKQQANLSLLIENPSKSKHIRSKILNNDQRVHYAPRYFGILHTTPKYNLFFRVYGLLETPGSEILTLSLYSVEEKAEYEFAIEEYIPEIEEFKDLSDDEKAEEAFQLFNDWGGLEKLNKIVSQFLKEKKSA